MSFLPARCSASATAEKSGPARSARHRVITLGVLALSASIALSGCGGDDSEPAEAASNTPTMSWAPTTPTPTPTPSESVSVPAEEPVVAPAPPVAPAPQPAYGAYPADQQAFIDAFQQGKTRYEEASTELQMSVALTDRDAQMCAVSSNGSMVNWTGKVVEIGANNDGFAHVAIELADGVKVQTWNNAFSDSMDNTLIPPSAPFFGTLTAMEEGTLVTFSAESVASDSSCLKGTNMTDTFYAIDPNFVVRMSDVRPQ